MARQDTVVGFQNYPLPVTSYVAGTEQALLAPIASGVYPGLPSPVFPLSTATYPDVLYVAPGADIAGSVYDGHPFVIKIAAKFTTTANCSILLNLYQATNAVLGGGPSSSAYSVVTALTGTGVTKLVTGTSTAANTTSGTILFSGSYMWDATSGLLGITDVATTYQKGVSISTTQSAATVASLAFKDLNFYPSFTFATSVPSVFTITEFVIDRL